MPSAPSSIKGALFGLLAFAMFALHDVVIKFLGVSYPVVQIVFFSALFSLPWIFLLIRIDGKGWDFRPKNPGWMGLRVVTSLITTASIYYAFTNLKLTEVYAILFTTPLFITALSVPMLKEHVGIFRWSGVLIGFCGVLVVLNPGVSPLGLGHAMALLGAFGAALAFLVMRKIGNQERTVVMAFYPLLINIVIMGSIMPFIYVPMPSYDFGLSVIMATLAFFAMLSMLAAYRRAAAVIVAPMQYSQILWALFYGTLFFNESLDLNVAVGTVIIVGSGVFILWRENRQTGFN